MKGFFLSLLRLNDTVEAALNDVGTLFQQIGDRLGMVMGGSSGVLMSLFFTALAKG